VRVAGLRVSLNPPFPDLVTLQQNDHTTCLASQPLKKENELDGMACDGSFDDLASQGFI
jgi:hypothetical protein